MRKKDCKIKTVLGLNDYVLQRGSFLMDDCIFCKIIRGEIPSKKVYEDEHTLAFLDINPASKYHTLVIPKNHCVNIYDVSVDELAKVMGTVKTVVEMYEEQYGMKHVNIVNNNGALAGQEVFHLHIHIIPKWEGQK